MVSEASVCFLRFQGSFLGSWIILRFQGGFVEVSQISERFLRFRGCL